MGLQPAGAPADELFSKSNIQKNNPSSVAYEKVAVIYFRILGEKNNNQDSW